MAKYRDMIVADEPAPPDPLLDNQTKKRRPERHGWRQPRVDDGCPERVAAAAAAPTVGAVCEQGVYFRGTVREHAVWDGADAVGSRLRAHRHHS
jgi:hypothetical protein